MWRIQSAFRIPHALPSCLRANVWWPIVIIAKPAGDASLILKERRIKHTDVIKKIKKKQLKLKKIMRRKTNWAKVLKIIINDLFEQKMNK